MAMEILIADSDKTDQEEFQRIFENTDYHPVFSDNGEDALLRAKLFKPDLIIAGVSLSEKDGLELCEAIKTDPEYRNIPFILLTEIFEDISDKDRARIGADGVISKPLREGAILSLVDQLMEDLASRKKEDEPPEGATEWEPLADTEKSALEGRNEFSLEGLNETEDEEIIELVDVVEEPEAKMSINDFALEREEPSAEMTPLESWEELVEEEKKPAEELPKRAAKAPPEKPEKKEEGTKGKPRASEAELSSDDELFEKIELEEILEKVERMKPSLEKEWPAKKEPKAVEWEPPAAEEGTGPLEWQLPTEEKGKATEWQPPPEEEKAAGWQLPADGGTEKVPGFEEFESALKSGILGEPGKDELEPLSIEAPEAEVPAETAIPPIEIPVEEEEMKAPPPEGVQALEVEEEELPEGLFEEEDLQEGDIGSLNMIEEESIEFIEDLDAPKAPPKAPVIKEAEKKRVEIFGEARAPEVPPVEEPSIEGADFFKERRAPQPPPVKETKEETGAPKISPLEGPLAEEIDFFKRWEPLKAPMVMPSESSKAEIPEERKPVRAAQQGTSLPAATVERQMEEVIAEGVRMMMEDFIKKILPEMTQNIIGLTADRIEKMVREIVPDLAEKAIQVEIKRLQKGEKE